MLAAPAARSPSSRPSQGPRRGGGGRGGGGGGGGSPKKAAELPSIVYRMDDGPKRVVISSGKARLFKEGNPLVYGGAVAEVRACATPLLTIHQDRAEVPIEIVVWRWTYDDSLCHAVRCTVARPTASWCRCWTRRAI